MLSLPQYIGPGKWGPGCNLCLSLRWVSKPTPPRRALCPPGSEADVRAGALHPPVETEPRAVENSRLIETGREKAPVVRDSVGLWLGHSAEEGAKPAYPFALNSSGDQER